MEGNYIGTDVTGNGGLGNDTGITIDAAGTAQRNIVRSNRIAFNRLDGIAITGNAVDNPILSNSIFANGFQSDVLGIDLGDDSKTPNDAGDADFGPNNLQNSPEISYATKSGNMLLVTYRVDSLPENSAYPLRVEFFQTGVIATGDQGETYLGFDVYAEADFAAGFKTVTIPTVAPLFIDGFVGIVATATDSLPEGGLANTSEFSSGVVLAAPWHNFFKPLDVVGGTVNDGVDGKITAGDALAIINYLNAFGAGPVPLDATIGEPYGYLDTVFDNVVAAADALEIINFLNAFGAEAEGEGGGLDAGFRGQESEARNQEIVDTNAVAGNLNDLIALLAIDSAAHSSRRRR